MANIEAALRALHSPQFERARMDGNEETPILPWEVALNDESQPGFRGMAAVPKDEANIENDIRHSENLGEVNEDVVAREVKSAEEK